MKTMIQKNDSLYEFSFYGQFFRNVKESKPRKARYNCIRNVCVDKVDKLERFRKNFFQEHTFLSLSLVFSLAKLVFPLRGTRVPRQRIIIISVEFSVIRFKEEEKKYRPIVRRYETICLNFILDPDSSSLI